MLLYYCWQAEPKSKTSCEFDKILILIIRKRQEGIPSEVFLAFIDNQLYIQ